MRFQTIALLLLGFLTWGQVRGQLILTQADNEIWEDKLKAEEDLSRQLDILRNRILQDTNVYVKNFGDRIILKTEKDRNKSDGICRPFLVIDGQPIHIKNETPTQKIQEFANSLTIENITQLMVAERIQAKSLHGSSGLCGLVALMPKNKRIKKKLLRING